MGPAKTTSNEARAKCLVTPPWENAVGLLHTTEHGNGDITRSDGRRGNYL